MSFFDTILDLLVRRPKTPDKKSSRNSPAKASPSPTTGRKPPAPRSAAAPSPKTEPKVDDYHFDWKERGPEERPSPNSAAPQEIRPPRQPETVSPPSGTSHTTQRRLPSEIKRSAEPAKNLYVYIDLRSQPRLERTADALAQRHPQLRARIGTNDALTTLFDLVFPHGMRLDYHVANLTWEEHEAELLRLAVRPVITPGRPWPFTKGCSIAAVGMWRVAEPNPIFQVQNFYEVADAPARPYEQSLPVFLYKENPQESHLRTRNLLTPGLARELPAIAVRTAKQLRNWSDFLTWKRKLILERTRGLRYTRIDWNEDRLVFRVLAENEDSLRESYGAVRQDDATAFAPQVSADPWTFRLGDQDNGRRTPRGFPLGRLNSIKVVSTAGQLPAGCPWVAPVAADVVVLPSEDDLNDLTSVEDPDEVRRDVLSRLPATGFLSNSSAGDVSLIRRHESAITRLRDQGGYAPYLSSYLFDVKQARLSAQLEPITHWFRDDLNAYQKEAVQKILAAPDLCLIQGPPGTGKTTVIAEAIMQLTRQGQSVLLVSQAHTAVDNALSRLGRHSDLRPIRLARFSDKISEEGRPFADSAALSRYYETLAEHAVQHYFSPWSTARERLDALQTWCEKAEYAQRDLAAANDALHLHDQARLRLLEARDHAWQELQARSQQQHDAEHHRQRLEGLQDFLTRKAEEIPAALALPEPASSELADVLFRLEDIRSKLPVSSADWAAVVLQRPQSLTGLVQFWRKLLDRRGEIERDVARLAATGPGPLQDPASAVRLQKCTDELKELERLLEDASDDPSLLKAWKAKRQELKGLRNSASGGLSIELYGDLFSDAEQICAPGQNADQLCGDLKARLSAIGQIAPLVDKATQQILAAVREEIHASSLSPISDDEVRERQRVLDQHDAGRSRVEAAVAHVDRRVEALVAEARSSLRVDMSAPEGNPFQACLRKSQLLLEAAENEVAGHDRDRAVWGPLLQDWHRDLSDGAAGRSDWPHFSDIFLPQCNAVGITCNEGERTLEQAGLVYFDVVIIDEVSKATPVEMLLPLMRARRAVLVGDHRQLPPLFQEGVEAATFSDVLEESVADDESRRTALTRENLLRFENMVTASLFKSHFEGADESIRARLDIQFRMHPQIMALVNHFYEHQLKCGIVNPDELRAHGITLTDRHNHPVVTTEDHVLWVDTTLDLLDRVYREDSDSGGRATRSNQLEAELIADTLVRMDAQCAAAGYSSARRKTVGVVSFYANQVRAIREAIRRVRPGGRFECLEVAVNTVIRYQGMEKQVILVSLVRNDGIDPRNRSTQIARRSSRANVARFEFINVAFSRAQELLVVFGARSMIESYLVELPNMDREGQTTRPVYKDILTALDRQARVIPASQFMATTAHRPRKPTRGPAGRPGER